jgi:hypothetical protein
MYEELHVAVATVRFDKHPLTGAQLAELVQWVARQFDEIGFIQVWHYYDGDVMQLGLSSSKATEYHVRIVPSLEDPPLINPEAEYTEVKVTDYKWGVAEGSGYNRHRVIEAVMLFADTLKQAYLLNPLTAWD